MVLRQVGEVCKKFGSFFQRPRGMYYSSMDRGLMSTMVWNWPQDEVEIIVRVAALRAGALLRAPFLVHIVLLLSLINTCLQTRRCCRC